MTGFEWPATANANHEIGKARREITETYVLSEGAAVLEIRRRRCLAHAGSAREK
jgi:hypothetical protein